MQGWKNRVTWQVWMYVSNDAEAMSDLRSRVVPIYKNYLPSSVFSRRGKAIEEVSEAVRKFIYRELDDLPWFHAMDSWAKGVFNSVLDDVDWRSIGKLLIENYEYAHNLEVRL